LFESNDENLIKHKEIEFIKLYRRKEDGGMLSNMIEGGEFNPNVVQKFKRSFKHTQKTKDFISECHRATKLTREVKDLIMGKQYRCLVEGCEMLNLEFRKEIDRIRYKSKLARFKILTT